MAPKPAPFIKGAALILSFESFRSRSENSQRLSMLLLAIRFD